MKRRRTPIAPSTAPRERGRPRSAAGNAPARAMRPLPRLARPGAPRRERDGAPATPNPLRIGTNVYIAQTMPGLEGVAWSEITARYRAAAESSDRTDSPRAPALRELGRRTVGDRAGITIFSAPRPELLAKLRTAEDIFAVAGYRYGLAGNPDALDQVRLATRETPYISGALTACQRMLPGIRGGHRIRFRVVARMAGEHEFRRIDFKHAVEQGMAERGDHLWRLDEEGADVEFWATMLADESILAIRISDQRMRHREYKVAHRPGSLRPSVAAALAMLSEPGPNDVVLDPLCGAGTILIERAHLQRYQLLIGSDHDPAALTAARENIGPRYKPIELHAWDAVALPLPDASVDRVITNLPWGIRYGSPEANRRSYPRMLAEFRRIVKRAGIIAILTGEIRLMSELIRRGHLRARRILRVSILGAPAAIYVCGPEN